LAGYFATSSTTYEDKMRFAVALGGTAYMLARESHYPDAVVASTEETRAALITILTELLSPVPVRTTTP